MKSVILLGGSNSVMKAGLQAGIKSALAQLNAKGGSLLPSGPVALNNQNALNAQNAVNLATPRAGECADSHKSHATKQNQNQLPGVSFESARFYNLAIGATGSLQNLYELARHRKLLQTADLIITESNINDASLVASYAHPLDAILQGICWLYEFLAAAAPQAKILALLLPLPAFGQVRDIINHAHLYCAAKFGLNICDMHGFYARHNLLEFYKGKDTSHPQLGLSRRLGENIVRNFSALKPHPHCSFSGELITLPASELISLDGEILHHENSAFYEKVLRLNLHSTAVLPQLAREYRLLLVHTWTICEPRFCAFLRLKNGGNITALKHFVCNQTTAQQIFAAPSAQDLCLECHDQKQVSEYSFELGSAHEFMRNDYIDIAGLLFGCDLLAPDFSAPVSFASLDFLLPDVLDYKEVIEEYLACREPC